MRRDWGDMRGGPIVMGGKAVDELEGIGFETVAFNLSMRAGAGLVLLSSRNRSGELT